MHSADIYTVWQESSRVPKQNLTLQNWISLINELYTLCYCWSFSYIRKSNILRKELCCIHLKIGWFIWEERRKIWNAHRTIPNSFQLFNLGTCWHHILYTQIHMLADIHYGADTQSNVTRHIILAILFHRSGVLWYQPSFSSSHPSGVEQPSLSTTMGVIPRDLENILVTDNSLWLKKKKWNLLKIKTKNCEELGASDRVSHWIIDNSLCRLPPPCSSASPSVAQSTPPSNHKVAPSHQPCCTINHI